MPDDVSTAHPASCRCWNCDMETTGLVKGLRAKIGELERYNAQLKMACRIRDAEFALEISLHKQVAELTKENAALQEQLAALRAALFAALECLPDDVKARVEAKLFPQPPARAQANESGASADSGKG